MCTNIPEPWPSYQSFFFLNALLGQEKRLQSQSANGSLLAGYQIIYFLCLWSKAEKNFKKAKNRGGSHVRHSKTQSSDSSTNPMKAMGELWLWELEV